MLHECTEDYFALNEPTMKRFTTEQLHTLLAWEAGEITEGHAAKQLGCDRLTARHMKIDAIQLGLQRAIDSYEPKEGKCIAHNPVCHSHGRR